MQVASLAGPAKAGETGTVDTVPTLLHFDTCASKKHLPSANNPFRCLSSPCHTALPHQTTNSTPHQTNKQTNSIPSLVAGLASAGVVSLCSYASLQQYHAGRTCKPATAVSLLVSASLTYVMWQRYSSSGKVMPAGVVAGISAAMSGVCVVGGRVSVEGWLSSAARWSGAGAEGLIPGNTHKLTQPSSSRLKGCS